MVSALSTVSPSRPPSSANLKLPLAARVRPWVWAALSSFIPPWRSTSLKSCGTETVSRANSLWVGLLIHHVWLITPLLFWLLPSAVALKSSKWVHPHWSGDRATLTLVHLNKEDEGMYTLRVNTKSGWDTYSAYVFVRGKVPQSHKRGTLEI